MRKFSKPFLRGSFLALIFVTSLHAQTANNVMPATASSTDQAPDSVMKKLSDLVHAGEYAEAQQLTTGLLLAYPSDQRLIKAKALLEKSLAAASAKGTPSIDPRASDAVSAQPVPSVSSTTAAQLTGMDKVDYNALILLARQAQQNADLEQQKASLKQFMDQSGPFLQKHPDQMLLWQLRAAAAISLNDPMAGYDAGQKLLAAGAAHSNDPKLQQLVAELKNKGWLEKQGAEDAKDLNWLRGLTLSLAYGEWSDGGFLVAQMKTTMTLTVRGLGDLKEPVSIRLENGSPKTCRLDGGALGTLTIKPGDAPGGTYTTTRTATLLGKSYEVPCTVTGSVVDKVGKEVSTATVKKQW